MAIFKFTKKWFGGGEKVIDEDRSALLIWSTKIIMINGDDGDYLCKGVVLYGEHN